MCQHVRINPDHNIYGGMGLKALQSQAGKPLFACCGLAKHCLPECDQWGVICGHRPKLLSALTKQC